MTTTAPIPPITGSATVAVPIDEAFRVFTGSIDAWWPHRFHIGAAEVEEVVLEPREDGRWYERGVDGTECDAGKIKVRFTASGPAETVVDVEHGSFERLVGGGTINDAIRGGGGWVFLLDGFGAVAAGRS